MPNFQINSANFASFSQISMFHEFMRKKTIPREKENYKFFANYSPAKYCVESSMKSKRANKNKRKKNIEGIVRKQYIEKRER